jgi:hypothetical protein
MLKGSLSTKGAIPYTVNIGSIQRITPNFWRELSNLYLHVHKITASSEKKGKIRYDIDML